ncbi:carboxylesterase family protein [Henriciella sp. AS95]|uniref:carboxylesterase/lipase family protein n=1 Tax=Henriciella sp. AS95 TaxID=3135782 RepID=UPI0031829B7B
MKLLLASSVAALGLIAAGCTTTGSGLPDGTVQTGSGLIAGATENGMPVYRGVPFAKPPVGDLRWKPPQAVSWDGVLDATEFGPACPQPVNADGSPNFGGYAGPVSEDCLTINIWTPEDAKDAPIMLWLFGGGGVVGAGSIETYNGTKFARDGVILATINYRLGALGGFAHPAITADAKDGEPVTNFHLLDAIAALQWLKTNAEAFGGDPDNITLFGESAGATMTANIVTSPLADGLVDKAIIESTGSLRADSLPLDRAETLGAKLAGDLGLDGANATLSELKALEVTDILSNRTFGRGSRTTQDPMVKPQSIIETFRAGTEIDIPMIIGTNSDEDRLAGTQEVASLAQDGAPVWQYFFHYVASSMREENPNGAPHAHEIPFVFDTLDRYPRLPGPTAEDEAVADMLHSCWVAFAKLPAGASEIECAGDFTWPARSDANNQAVAVFEATPSVGTATELKSPPNGAEPGRTSRPGS